MRVTTSDGTTYQVAFVHSAHDIKHPLPGRPGGLRQIVDGLAKSLRRRVTLCEISVADAAPEVTTSDVTPEDVKLTFTPLSYGFSVCHYFDQFVKAEGRARAFDRALRSSGLDATTKDELAVTLGY
jgi:hypothetical protein